jgi:hypothetical protein
MEDMYMQDNDGRSEAGGPVTSQSDRGDGASELQDEDQGASADNGENPEENETEDEDREGENRYWNLKQVEDEVVRKVNTSFPWPA